ncbi:MAG: Wzz/FepE/Etk N-terminal domain-containing protein [Rhodobacterales bacterium]|nr:Wzz/FepE/Etk N-terminal domain-containing protein [Rhodobacterales bacterium]
MEKFLPLSELIAAFRRHVMMFAVIVVLGMVVSVVYALNQPRIYQTTAMIQVLQPTIANPRDSGTSSAPTLQLLQVVEQRLMTRDNLIRMIEKHGLYANPPNIPMADRVLKLRLATQVEMIVDPNLRWRSDISPTALLVRVSDGDPALAAMLANEFVASIIEQNRQSRADQTGTALAFFESEEQRVGREIARLDAQIVAFKEANADLLPDGLAALRVQLATLEETRLELESQIAELNNGTANGATAVVNKRLAQLGVQYNLIEQRRQSIINLINQAPQAERQHLVLTRKLQQLTDQFEVINQSRAKAKMDQMLEAGRQGENFKVLETALVPVHPIAPNRKKIAMTGSAASVVLALALILLLEMRKPVIRTSAQLERRLNLRPVVAIPTLTPISKSGFARLKTGAFMALGGIFIALVMVFVFSS